MSEWRQPAEWERHRACWVAWPSHAALWGEALAEVQQSFEAMCRAIAHGPEGEALEVLVLDPDGEAAASAALAGLAVRFHRIPFGDIWLRDTAPVFVCEPGGGVAPTAFIFNGWGGKYRLPGDAGVAASIAARLDASLRRFSLIAEGGAIEADGAGTGLTTRQCLLNDNRNPGASEGDVETVLHEALGIERLVWLDEGLANDHTDGHVDTLARFVAPGRVVCMAPEPGDPNRTVLEAIRRTLEAARDVRGRRLEVVAIPSPGRVEDSDGRPLPASYVNFYIAHHTVVVPTYGVAADDPALEAIAALFPGREAVAVPSRALLGGGGAVHCITQQEPLPGALPTASEDER